MKILLCINDLSRGGAERQLVLLAIGLKRAGHDVLVLTLWNDDVYLSNLNYQLLKDGGVQVSSLTNGSRVIFMLYYHLTNKIKEFKPDIIYSMLPIANCFIGLFKILNPLNKVVFGVRIALEKNEKFKLTTRFSFSLERFLMRWVDFVICNSELAMNYLVRDGIKRPIIVIQNGIDLTLNNKQQDIRNILFRNFSLSEDVFIFGAIGRVQEQKDYMNLLDAVVELKKISTCFVVFVVGRIQISGYYQKLVNKIEQLEIGRLVYFLDESDQINSFLSSIDGFVSSSVSEGFSNVIVEAMAHQLPCIVTSVGDNEFIGGGLSYLVPSRDSRALAYAMEQLLNLDIGDRFKLGMKHRRRAEDFSIENMVDKTEKILFEISRQRTN